jgi:PAS domain S-box-containing protein
MSSAAVGDEASVRIATPDASTPEALIRACPVGMVLIDERGLIQLVNPELDRMFGYLPGELIGLSFELIVPKALLAQHALPLFEFARPREPLPFGAARALRASRPDGSELEIDLALAHVPCAEGPRIAVMIADVSERQRLARATELRLAELERSNADLEQFASTASHDLREPLRMVASYTQLLSERYRGQLDEKADKFIGYAVEGAQRMQRLIDDLLAYARLENAGRPSMPIAVGDALRDTLADMRVFIQDHSAQISYARLPTVLVDPVQLAQLLQNLIHNAIKFRSEAPPHIELSADRDGPMWRITVKDNGIGIDKRYHERIFQMFQRLHERAKYDGNGIGLATARKIVERHGGMIGVTSTPGQGATFHFTLPAANYDEMP